MKLLYKAVMWFKSSKIFLELNMKLLFLSVLNYFNLCISRLSHKIYLYNLIYKKTILITY